LILLSNWKALKGTRIRV